MVTPGSRPETSLNYRLIGPHPEDSAETDGTKKHQPPPKRGLVMVVRRFRSSDLRATRTRKVRDPHLGNDPHVKTSRKASNTRGWGMTPNPYVDVVKVDTFVLLLFPRRLLSRSESGCAHPIGTKHQADDCPSLYRRPALD